MLDAISEKVIQDRLNSKVARAMCDYEREIWERCWREPDNGALHYLMKWYDYVLRRACERARSNLPRHVEYDEITCAAKYGLVDAIRKWEPRKGAAFATYAPIRIVGAIKDWMRQVDPMARLNRGKLKEKELKIDAYEAIFGRTPSTEELAHYSGTTRQSIEDIEQSMKAIETADIELFKKTLESKSKTEEEPDNPAKNPIFRGIKPVAISMLILWKVNGLTIDAVAHAFHTNSVRVSQLMSETIEKLKKQKEKTDAPGTHKQTKNRRPNPNRRPVPTRTGKAGRGNHLR